MHTLVHIKSVFFASLALEILNYEIQTILELTLKTTEKHGLKILQFHMVEELIIPRPQHLNESLTHYMEI